MKFGMSLLYNDVMKSKIAIITRIYGSLEAIADSHVQQEDQ